MRGKDILGIINILIVIGVLGAISYAALVLQPPEYDPNTLCLSGEQPAHMALVIDKTDLYSPEQASRIEQLALDSHDRLEIGERLSLYELDARGELINTNSFSLCNPGRGDQINPLYRNPARVEARYQALFEGPLQSALWSNPRKAQRARLSKRWPIWRWKTVSIPTLRAARSFLFPTCCRIHACSAFMAAPAPILRTVCRRRAAWRR